MTFCEKWVGEAIAGGEDWQLLRRKRMKKNRGKKRSRDLK
jgi:hypothetical protein